MRLTRAPGPTYQQLLDADTHPVPAVLRLQSPQFLGDEDIPVERIIGSLGRARDFDREFRPLKRHLRDRWVRVYLDLEADRWEPIRVHKLGDEYFVEDGHHRVSVARHTGHELAAGVYAQVHGPCYETKAEIRALRACGADAVGMSTVHEVEAAARLGMRCAALSCSRRSPVATSSKTKRSSTRWCRR